MSNSNTGEEPIYPFEDSDEDIKEQMNELIKVIANSNYSINDVMRLGPLINLGNDELQRRSEKEAVKAMDESHKLSNNALAIAVIAIALSVFSLFYNSNSNEDWQKSQLEILQSINSNTSKSAAK